MEMFIRKGKRAIGSCPELPIWNWHWRNIIPIFLNLKKIFIGHHHPLNLKVLFWELLEMNVREQIRHVQPI